jgi:hypothetical protein
MEGYIVDYSLLNRVKESGLEERPTIIFNYFNQLISNCVPEQLKGSKVSVAHTSRSSFQANGSKLMKGSKIGKHT